MTDFHHNIFYYYKGPQYGKQGPCDQQLEDNTTKALINTLKHCNPVVRLKFLNWLGIDINGKTEFELQKSTIGSIRICRTKQRLLLGIVDKPNSCTDFSLVNLRETTTRDSRPDAWLYGDDFVVLIESKVGEGSLELNQMRCHFQKLENNKIKARYQKITWAEIHLFFSGLVPDLKDKDKWIVEQFIEFLEWNGMSTFSGFEEWMFEYFIPDIKDADTKKQIRNTMGLFANKILDDPNGLKSLDASFYQIHHEGNFNTGDDHFWAAFGPPNFKDVTHQTVALYDYGLDVFINVELLPVVNMLRKKLKVNKSLFINIISNFPGRFQVRIEERKPSGLPKKFDYYTIATLDAGVRGSISSDPYGLKDPKSNGFDYLEELLFQIQYPYLTIRKSIERKKVLELSKGDGMDLVNEVLCIMKNFHRLVEFINS